MDLYLCRTGFSGDTNLLTPLILLDNSYMVDGVEPVPGQSPIVENKVKPSNIEVIQAKIEKIVSIDDQLKRTEAEDLFIQDRIGELVSQSEPTTMSLVNGSRYKGFVHPETRIIRNFMVDPIRIDDPEIYILLMETIVGFRQNPNWKDKSIREIAMHALTHTIGKYFGNYFATSDTDQKNRQFYWEHGDTESEDLSLADFKGKHIGVCAEKAGAAQNLLVFMGYDSELILSTNNNLSDTDPAGNMGHAYLVIKSENGYFIYDPTNPVIANREYGILHTVFPSIYPINEEQHQKLIDGEGVEVAHRNLLWDGNTYQPVKSAKRVYGGPKIDGR